MGTTLTGTTPQDTYDSLIKVTDNGPLSGTAKFLSDGLGNDSVLALSTTALGIGTTSLSGKFHAQATNSGIFFDLTTAYTPIIKAAGAISDLQIESVGSGGNLILGAGGAASIITFFTNGNSSTGERMRITSAGNVGIGTTAPSAILDVRKPTASGDTQFNFVNSQNSSSGNTSVTSSLYLGFNDDSSGLANANKIVTGKSGDYTSGPNANSFLAFYTTAANSTTEKVRITSTGNVGIGTSAPATKLHVNTGDTYGAQINTTQTISTTTRLSIGGFTNDAAGGNGSVAIGGAHNHAASAQSALTFYTHNGSNLNEVGRFLAAGGLTFNGDTAAANALDDYEEGTWTMGVSFGGSSVGVTFSQNTGTYTKIGRQVTATGQFVLSSKGAQVGSATLTGLPFTSGSGEQFHSGVSFGVISSVSFADMLTARVAVGATSFDFYETTNAGVISFLTDADFANNSQMAFSLTYFV